MQAARRACASGRLRCGGEALSRRVPARNGSRISRRGLHARADAIAQERKVPVSCRVCVLQQCGRATRLPGRRQRAAEHRRAALARGASVVESKGWRRGVRCRSGDGAHQNRDAALARPRRCSNGGGGDCLCCLRALHMKVVSPAGRLGWRMCAGPRLRTMRRGAARARMKTAKPQTQPQMFGLFLAPAARAAIIQMV